MLLLMWVMLLLLLFVLCILIAIFYWVNEIKRYQYSNYIKTVGFIKRCFIDTSKERKQ